MATSGSASTSEEKSSTRTRTRKGPKGFRNIRKNGDSNYYRELLLSEFDDILVDQLPNELPPLREINHRIPYKPTKPWIAHKYRLPEAHKQALERDVNEQELLALEDTIKTYEHWLIGRTFTAFTDSQDMLSLMKQKHLSPRQWRSVTYLSKFDINFKFIEGKKNIIADLLSRIAERSTYKHDLPYLEESDTHLAAIQLRRGKTLLEKPAIKKRTLKVAIPREVEITPKSAKGTPQTSNESTIQNSEMTPNMIGYSLSDYQSAIVNGYKSDVLFSKALKSGVDSGVYRRDSKGLLYTGPERDRLCIPDIKVRGGRDGAKRNLREMLIAHAHETLGHMSLHKTNINIGNQYYWKTITGD